MGFFSQLKRLWKTEEKTGVSEETKQRVYQIHMESEVLFYVDDIYQEQNEKVITVVGEWVKGSLEKKEHCSFLNCDGLPMREGRILGIKETMISYSKFLRDEQKTVLKVRILDGSLEDVQAASMLVRSDSGRETCERGTV